MSPPASPLPPPARTVVCKFGGTSLADADQLRKVRDIVRADPARRVVVPSAPGKRFAEDRKITDLLYVCHDAAVQGLSFGEAFGVVADRFRELVAGLGLSVDLDGPLEAARAGIAEHAAAGRGPDFAASRGEALNGPVVAALLECPCIDAAEVIRFGVDGLLDAEATHARLIERLAGVERAVVPGFYGRGPDGHVRTFSRGGSDVTGAVVARALHADVYENWTDVPGLLMADPRIVENPRPIGTLTYRELRELSYSGATVLHPEATFPVRAAGIPVNIRSTNEPDHPGTRIVDAADAEAGAGAGPGAGNEAATKDDHGLAPPVITGIAGRTDFTVISLERELMNEQVGYVERVLGVFRRAGVSVEHVPSGIDTLSVVVADAELGGRRDAVLDELARTGQTDRLEVDPDLALIATVGRHMKTRPGMAATLFRALADAAVNIRMIDQGSSELNIIVGVDVADYETAVRAIYAAFVTSPPLDA